MMFVLNYLVKMDVKPVKKVSVNNVKENPFSETNKPVNVTLSLLKLILMMVKTLMMNV